MAWRTKYLIAIATVIAMAAIAVAATSAHADPVGPYLNDAPFKPSMLQRLAAHHSKTFPAGHGYANGDNKQCARGGYWSDFQAYRTNGYPMIAQRWNRAGDRTWWRYPRTHTRVVFDGITFHNYTDHAVLIAGWCEGGGVG